MSTITSTLALRVDDAGLQAKLKADAAAAAKFGASMKDLNKVKATPGGAAMVKQLEQLSKTVNKLDGFQAATKGADELGKKLRTQRVEVERYAKAMAAAEKKVSFFDRSKRSGSGNYAGFVASGDVAKATKDLRAATRAHTVATRTLGALEGAYRDARITVRGMTSDMQRAGIPLNNIGRTQADLRGKIEATTRALNDQARALGVSRANAPGQLAGAVAAGRASRSARFGQNSAALEGAVLGGRGSREARLAAQAQERTRRSGASASMIAGMGAVGGPVSREVAARARIAQGMGATGRPTGTMASGALPKPGDPEGSMIFDTMKGVGASAAAKRAFEATTSNWSNMDEAVRRQRAILGIDESAQERLKAQAYQIGKDTRFTNPDVVKGQTRIGSSLPDHLKDPAVIAAITENAKNYALAMGTTLDEGSSAILGRMLGLRMDMSTPGAAGAASKEAANKLVQWAKASGADHNDIMGYTKFGAAPGSVGGFAPEFSDALTAQLRRIGFEGSMGGNFVRAAATKLAVPTSKGLGALAASGIDHSNYVQQGKELSAENLSKVLKLKYGKGLTDSQQARIHALMQDETVVGNRDEFVPQVSEIVQETLARKNKKGSVNAQDARSIAKSVNEFLNVSAGAVDIQRLMRDVIPLLKGSPALSKYLFGQEHGGRAQALDVAMLDKDTASFRNTPGNRAQGVGEEVNAGFYGARQRYQGSVETFWTRLGEVADGPLTTFYNTLGNSIDRVSGLPDALLGVGAAAASAGAALLTIKGAASAGALLGLPGAAAVSAGASAAGSVGTVIAGGAIASVAANEAVKNKEFAAPYLDGGMLGADPAGYGIGAGIMHAPDALKAMSDANKRRLGSLPPGTAGMPAPAPVRLPGLDGRPKVQPEVEDGALSRLHQRADEARASLEQAGKTTVAPTVDSSGLDGLIAKAHEALRVLGQIPGAIASASNAGQLTAARDAARVRASFSDGVTRYGGAE